MHIPFYFFTTKEYVLVLYDEVVNRSLSTHLEAKLADFYKRKGADKADDQNDDNEEEKPLLVKREAEHHPTVDRPETLKTLETDQMVEKSDTITAVEAEKKASQSTSNSEYSAITAKSALTYKLLSDRVFILSAIFIHVATISLAVTITDIAVVFEVCGSITSNAQMFFFPGVGYLLALNRYGSSSIRQKWETTFFCGLAWFFIIFSIYLFGQVIVVEVFKAMGKLPEADTGFDGSFDLDE